MPQHESNHNRELKVIILAAGKESGTTDVKPILLQNLGSHKVIDYVVQNALQLVSPEDLYIVVGHESEEMRSHLGGDYHYICQEEQLGTGHAVLKLKPFYQGFHR